MRILCHLLYLMWLDPPRCRNTQTVTVMDWQSPRKWDSSKHYIKHAFLMFSCCFQVPYCMWFQCWFVCIVNYNALGHKGTTETIGIFVLCFCVKLVHLVTILNESQGNIHALIARSSRIPIMASHLVGANLLSDLAMAYCQLNIPVKYRSK